MELLLERKYLKSDYTIGRLYVNGVFFCNTLEDKNRDINKSGNFDFGESKVYGETCIPYGRYKVIVNYSNKFRRELPLLLDVPNFTGIRIHRGNTPKDTLGCILVGENKKKGMVLNSTTYEVKLINIIKDSLNKKEEVFINII